MAELRAQVKRHIPSRLRNAFQFEASCRVLRLWVASEQGSSSPSLRITYRRQNLFCKQCLQAMRAPVMGRCCNRDRACHAKPSQANSMSSTMPSRVVQRSAFCTEGSHLISFDISRPTHAHTHIYIYMYIYVYTFGQAELDVRLL